MFDSIRLQGGSSLFSHSKCLRTAELIAACLAIGGCSLGDFSYLQEDSAGGTVARGGSHSSNSSGGNDAKGGNDATSGGNDAKGGEGSGGTSNNSQSSGGSSGKNSGGTSSTGGSSSGPCEAGQSQCGEPAVCVDLTRGTASGSTVDNCGACGTKCSLNNATSATCADSRCHGSCDSGYADCNSSNTNDGCETDTLSSVQACGACSRTCSSAGVKTQGCSEGKCKPTCAAKHFDCNQDMGTGADDGCEATLDSHSDCGTTCDNRESCSSTQVCNDGVCGAPQQIMKLSVPMTEAGQAQRFAEKLALSDLTGASLIMRMYAPEGANDRLSIYVTDADYTAGSPGIERLLNTLSQGWTDVVLPIGEARGGFDPTVLTQVNFEIYASGSGPWGNTAVLYIDRIWSTNGAFDDGFLNKNNFVISGSMAVENSAYELISAMP